MTSESYPLLPKGPDQFSQQFITDNGLVYSILVFKHLLLESLILDLQINFCGSVLEFSFLLEEDKETTGIDNKIEETIISVLKGILLNQIDLIIIGVYDSRDERQQAREKLFSKWALRHQNAITNLFFYSNTIATTGFCVLTTTSQISHSQLKEYVNQLAQTTYSLKNDLP